MPDHWGGWIAARVRERWVVALVAVALGVGGWWLLRSPAEPVEATLPMAAGAVATPSSGSAGGTTQPAGTDGVASSTTAADLVVQAAGAVRRPGVYRVPPGARVDDLVRRAGGLAAAADRDRINLAAALHDGERVWIPARGEAEPPSVVAGGASGEVPTGGGPAAPTVPAAPVDLNAATADQLDALPGIGPATATAILAHRDQVGAFRSVDDLLEVRGIGEAKLEQLRPLVTV